MNGVVIWFTFSYLVVQHHIKILSMFRENCSNVSIQAKADLCASEE